ncbi:amidohydrolase family protein [Candidatus Neomarinimicrobiota bacterium]
MSILIKNVRLGDEYRDLLLADGRISKISPRIDEPAEETIEGEGNLAIPPFVNGHTHAAMALLRGYADDLPLDEWLNTRIWPVEARLTEDDVYWGTRLACNEMIRSGTTMFNDMYWHYHGVARAVQDAGIRAAVSAVFIDLFSDAKAAEQVTLNERLLEESGQYGPRVRFTLGPHAIYTVSEKSLRWIRDFAEEHGLLVHIHLSETREEVAECLKRYEARPVEYLDRIGFLGPNVIAAHVIWVNEPELDILRERGVKVVYNPTSNMKLASGIFPYHQLNNADVSILLGTDGCASNNNLDMFEEMKFASLLQKISQENPSILDAHEVYGLAGRNGAAAFGLDYEVLKVGNPADLILIDLEDIHLVPDHQTVPNLVYSASGSCVHTTICDGKILMRDRQVAGEEEVIVRAREVAARLTRS